MEKQKAQENNQKSILILIIVVLLFNTLSILGIYFILDRRIDKLEIAFLQNLKQEAGEQKGITASEIDIPDSVYEHLGVDDAPIRLTLIVDMECPYCEQLYATMFPAVIDKYVNRGLVRLSYTAFPLESKHPKALPAAAALSCADQQGKLWLMFNYLAGNINDFSLKQLQSLPDGIDPDSDFLQCLSDSGTIDHIREMKNAYADAGIKGTPSIIVILTI